MRHRSLLFALTLGLSAASAATSAGCAVEQDEEADFTEDELTTKLSVDRIPSARTFSSVSIEGGGFGQAGRLMKFLVDARTAAKKTYFINQNYKVGGKQPSYAKYHYYFAKHELGIADDIASFNQATYNSATKRYYAGTVQTYTLGDAEQLVYAIQFYPDDVISEEVLLDACKTVRARITIPNAKVAFVATGPQQTFARVGPALRAAGIEPMTIDQVLGSVKYLPLNPGEAWGYLRIFPRDSGELRPTDIPVFDELPLDLTVVAGTITRAYQDVTSHVNLKSKERGTPNMVLRDASPTQAKLAAFADKPVHLKVGKGGWVLEATTAEIVEQKLRDRTNKPWIALPAVAERTARTYDEMCPALAASCTENGNRFGGKAAMLGFLANKSVLGRVSQPGSMSKKVGYDLVPFGFGIPVQFYRDFVDAPENAALKAKIADLVAREKAGTLSPNERARLAADVQALFYKARIPAAQMEQIERQLAALKQKVPNLDEMKIRSSANAEDIPNFDGAGLHDSFSAEIDKTDNPDFSCNVERVAEGGVVTKLKVKPKTPQCAVKAVYASLWNPRAIDERSFARIDHATAAMGIAVVPAYDTDDEVTQNGVLITRAINAEDILGYTLSLQAGNNLVTNPEPGTVAQLTLATFSDLNRPPRFTVARYATPTKGAPPLTRSVLEEPKMREIVDVGRAVETAYCSVKRGYYDGDCKLVAFDNDKPRALDMELKVLQNGRIVLKQAREFHGR